MLANNMQSAVIQALRACGRTTLTAAPLASRAFLIAPSYKLRLAVRGYATATATKKKTATAKKPVAKSAATSVSKAAGKKPVAKKATTKATTKAKATKKPKKVAAKKPVKRVKKELSPEKKALLLKRELKKKAMINAEPKQLAVTPWTLFVGDHVRGSLGAGEKLGDKVKAISAQFANISAAEKERLQQICNENKITNAANYKKWVESHSVADIASANHARARLIRTFGLKINPMRITDARMPKRPLSSFGQYIKAQGSAHDLPAREMMKALSAEWKVMSPTEKKPYQDLEAADISRYQKDMDRISA